MEENKNFEIIEGKGPEKEENKIQIVVDDGKIEVPICNTLGEQIGSFRFRPTDFNIVRRYNEVSAKFENVVEPLTNANIDPNGEGADEESMKILDEAENRLFELVDYLFDGNASEAFFAKVNAFSPVQGKFYCEHALNAVGNFISKQFDAEIQAINARVQKYTHGYEARTGKHKGGKK